MAVVWHLDDGGGPRGRRGATSAAARCIGAAAVAACWSSRGATHEVLAARWRGALWGGAGSGIFFLTLRGAGLRERLSAQ